MSTKREAIAAMTAGLAEHISRAILGDQRTVADVKAALEQFKWKGEGCLGKAALDEPVFVLRARDPLFRETVQRWAIAAKRDGCHESEKAQAAVEEAHAGGEWRKAYLANLDAEDLIAHERMAAEQGSDV